MSLPTFIKKTFKGIINERYISHLLKPNSVSVYNQCFTSAEINSEKNYEYFEQLGDVSANKFLVWYFYKRFPQLECAKGVKVVARLKINEGSKKSFSQMARKLGFWNYIRASEDEKKRDPDSLLEDVFEAFVGATEYLLDRSVHRGIGQLAITDFLTHHWDKKHISLCYEHLFDSKTRLKELFDRFPELGRVKYKDFQERNVDKPTVSTCTIYRHIAGQKKPVFLAQSQSRLKSDAQRAAATIALKKLKREGWTKTPPPEYHFFAQSSRKKNSIINE